MDVHHSSKGIEYCLPKCEMRRKALWVPVLQNGRTGADPKMMVRKDFGTGARLPSTVLGSSNCASRSQNGSKRRKRKEENGTSRPGKLYHSFISDSVCSNPSIIYQVAATKKRKLAQADGAPRKEKFADRGFIPVPVNGNDEDVELSDEDVGMLEEFGSSVGFLTQLDKKGIMRCVCHAVTRVIVL